MNAAIAVSSSNSCLKFDLDKEVVKAAKSAVSGSNSSLEFDLKLKAAIAVPG
jgi:hypothetical protein